MSVLSRSRRRTFSALIDGTGSFFYQNSGGAKLRSLRRQNFWISANWNLNLMLFQSERLSTRAGGVEIFLSVSTSPSAAQIIQLHLPADVHSTLVVAEVAATRLSQRALGQDAAPKTVPEGPNVVGSSRITSAFSLSLLIPPHLDGRTWTRAEHLEPPTSSGWLACGQSDREHVPSVLCSAARTLRPSQNLLTVQE